MTRGPEPAGSDARAGVLAGLLAFALWGFFPVYFKLIEAVSPVEILAHRVAWAVPFGALIIAMRMQWSEVRLAFGHKSMLAWLAAAALFISVNWLTYIWAVTTERIYEASLGYYINPLIYVLAGVVLLGERLRSLQLFAVVLAAIGVLVLVIAGNTVPWASLWLAVSFTAYGVIRKRVVIGAMPGLFVETTLLLPLALAWLAWSATTGGLMFASGDTFITGMLVFAGPVTVIPLLLFAIAARRVSLTIVGFMQFLAPTLQFLTGVYYGEELTVPHLVCFSFIWLAVTVFSVDAVMASKKPPQARPAEA